MYFISLVYNYTIYCDAIVPKKITLRPVDTNTNQHANHLQTAFLWVETKNVPTVEWQEVVFCTDRPKQC